jgi:hypothetical protein
MPWPVFCPITPTPTSAERESNEPVVKITTACLYSE